jgi:hypothetical protein
VSLAGAHRGAAVDVLKVTWNGVATGVPSRGRSGGFGGAKRAAALRLDGRTTRNGVKAL